MDTRDSALGGLPRPGEVVCGKYRVDSVIGTGGMGVVMGGVDLSLGRPIAIKFLSPRKAVREDSVARFIREARAAASIQSEHVVRVYEVGMLPGGAPFIVMEHLQGEDLGEVLRTRGTLPIEDACDFLLQACEAIGEAHLRGVVHRDLKPQNLFLAQRPDGSPCTKVLDFGISKAADTDGSTPNLTATDTVMGTPLYMSPEQVRSLKSVDARADIWALGAILFELLTGTPVFLAPTASALCAMIAMDPATPLRARRPGAPAELEALILRCLVKDPAGRFPDVAALADALAPFASDRGRVSAMRISRVMRGGMASPPVGSVPPMSPKSPALELLSTSMAEPPWGTPRSAGVSSPVPGRSGAPPGPPATMNAWDKPNAPPPARKRMGGAAVALLGVATGLALFALLGGGAYWLVLRRAAHAAAPTVTSASAAATTITPAPTAPPSARPAPLPTTTPSAAPSVKPPSVPTTVRDAGAPSVPKDGGASPAPPNRDKEEAERNAVLGRAAEQNCANHTRQMTTFAQDDASRKRAAQQAKTFMCRGMSSSRCERDVCLKACMVLNDQACVRDITYVIEHGPAPKY